MDRFKENFVETVASDYGEASLIIFEKQCKMARKV